jgi:hypothetical protein
MNSNLLFNFFCWLPVAARRPFSGLKVWFHGGMEEELKEWFGKCRVLDITHNIFDELVVFQVQSCKGRVSWAFFFGCV